MSLLSPENKQERLNELYEYGKSKGALTYKEIMDRIVNENLFQYPTERSVRLLIFLSPTVTARYSSRSLFPLQTLHGISRI